jgi:DNA-binding beta-propeller fold protein YncE
MTCRCILTSGLLFALAGELVSAGDAAKSATGFRLEQTYALPGVRGRIDHLAFDLAGQRLFVCALGNDSLEVLDLREGKRIHTITGLGSPQDVAYLPTLGRLLVTNDSGGACNIYDGKSFASLGTVSLGDDADNIRAEESGHAVYVGYGNGGIAMLDPKAAKTFRTVGLSGHPEAFVIQKRGPRIFINLPTAREVAVVDREHGRVMARWPLAGAAANFPMAFDEGNHRLFVGCRSPAQLVVLDSDSGSVVTTLTIPADVDDLFYVESLHAVLAICGVGSVAMIEQVAPNSYKSGLIFPTAPGARTGLYVAALQSLFVAVPQRDGESAEVRRYLIK